MSDIKSIYEKLAQMRVELQSKKLTKTGKNTYSKYDYYELSDFLPSCNSIAASYKTLLPGDLIFYSYEKNGRYRNISHIEMYVGNGKNVSASSSYGRVVHYDYHTSCTALIARPCK